MQVERVGLNAVQLAVSSDLRLALVEVRLSARLAVELLDVIGACVEQVAVVRLLVASCEATEDEDVLVRDLVQSAAFEADPVCVLLDAKVERLPVLSPLDVVLLDQVGPLTAVEASNDVQRLVVEGNRSVEVSSGVETGDLCPCVAADVVDLALVHGFTGQRASDRVDA